MLPELSFNTGRRNRFEEKMESLTNSEFKEMSRPGVVTPYAKPGSRAVRAIQAVAEHRLAVEGKHRAG